ncbi:MAG: siroheme decarboxylase subunit beta [Hyphomicrobiales bacterium]
MSSALIDPAVAMADLWQRNFPLCTRPFATIGRASGLSEGEVLDAFDGLSAQGILGRIGAAVRPNTVGASTLAAMAVPEERLEEVAELVNRQHSVNHNYQREHLYNLWFVVTADCRQSVLSCLAEIELLSGLKVIDLPLERSYHIDLGFRLNGAFRGGKKPTPIAELAPVEPEDRRLVCAIEEGLPLSPRPYLSIAERLGWTEAQVLRRLEALIQSGIISRFGCILRHRKLGFTANAMAVWNVDNDKIDAIAQKLAARHAVTLCYRRARRLPDWPYNLFAMIHGHARHEVEDELREAELDCGLYVFEKAILFSKRCFKQRGAVFNQRQVEAVQ